MFRNLRVVAFVIAAWVAPSFVWSQTTGTGVNSNNDLNEGPREAANAPTDATANPGGSLGTSNPATGGTTTSRAPGASSAASEGQRSNRQTGGAFGRDSQQLGGAGATPDDWRMVQHKGRWWYWTPNNTWLYRHDNRWSAYIPPTGDRRADTRDLQSRRQYRAGYRGDTMDRDRSLRNDAVRDNQMMENNAHLRGGVGDSAMETQGALERRGTSELRGGVRGEMGTNANLPGFEATRPLAPTAAELQGFYQRQDIQATPYGGTTGGARNDTPLGGGATRSGPGIGSPGNPSTTGPDQNVAPGTGPATNSPGNPAATGNPGNPAPSGTSSGAAGAGGSGTSGGVGGASGAGGAGAGGTGAGGAGGGSG